MAEVDNTADDRRRQKNREKANRYRAGVKDSPKHKAAKAASNAKWRQANADEVRLRNKAWREANPDRHRENNAAWRRSNAAAHAASRSAYGQANKERIAAYQLAYRARKKEDLAESRRLRRETNPEAFAEAHRRWRENNPNYKRDRYASDEQHRIVCILRSRFLKAVRAANGKKAHKTANVIGCTPAEVLIYIADRFVPGMTWSNHGEWEIDHVRPCASYDLTDPDQQRACFHYTNLQPLWAGENRLKSAKWTEPMKEAA